MKRAAVPMASAATPSVRSREDLDFAFSYLEDEHSTLQALAIALESRLHPQEFGGAPGCEDAIAWRLSRVLLSRLEQTQFLNDMHVLITGGTRPDFPG